MMMETPKKYLTPKSIKLTMNRNIVFDRQGTERTMRNLQIGKLTPASKLLERIITPYEFSETKKYAETDSKTTSVYFQNEQSRKRTIDLKPRVSFTHSVQCPETPRQRYSMEEKTLLSTPPTIARRNTMQERNHSSVGKRKLKYLTVISRMPMTKSSVAASNNKV